MAKKDTNKSRISISQDQLTDMIRKKAHELYEKSGKKPGRDMENWLEAEKIIKRNIGSV